MAAPGGGGWPAQGRSGERRTRPVSGIEGGVAGLLLVRGIGEWRSEVAKFRKGAELASYMTMAQAATPSSRVGAACDARVSRQVCV